LVQIEKKKDEEHELFKNKIVEEIYDVRKEYEHKVESW
jgi:hypothetical protein